MTTHCVVTGAAGFIGSHLVDRLLAQGDRVTAIDSFDRFYARGTKARNIAHALQQPRYRLVEGDIADSALLDGVLTKDSVVVHLAARAGVRPSIDDPRAYVRINVEGTASVVEAMRRAGATRLIFASSSSVYGNSTPAPFNESAPAIAPISPYAASKRAGELFLTSAAPLYRMHVAILRFFTVFGPRQRPDLAIHKFAAKMMRGEQLALYGDGSQARDYTYCDDIVDGVIAAMDWTASAPVGADTFNLGGSHTVTLGVLVATLADALGIDANVTWQPMQAGDVELTSANIAKSARMLGYAPKVSFPEGIRRFVEWFREEPLEP